MSDTQSLSERLRDGGPMICTEAAAALDAKDTQIKRLRETINSMGSDGQHPASASGVTRTTLNASDIDIGAMSTVLGNMALENKDAVFNRWSINHERCAQMHGTCCR
jgi:hypothetical protein